MDAESLTPDSFLEELRERLDALRSKGVDVPVWIDSQVLSVVGGPSNPFEEEVFRLFATHLLEGLDPELAGDEDGDELLADRVWELPANLRTAMSRAVEPVGQPV